ncbi:hypothetical protein FE257_000677 [Aspergillus nanangensis]|uniref:Uncharacterized protein n=1 Tax=Aspergillus nanangensis TaxID=2582783 RepID=A0AAD4CER2_ASPNN|nr:hypothetical protein FE257_000677 [Aspergillus nanangensis]
MSDLITRSLTSVIMKDAIGPSQIPPVSLVIGEFTRAEGHISVRNQCIMNRTSSGDMTAERSYETPVAPSIPNDQYYLAQQPDYPHSTTLIYDFYAPQPIQTTPVPVQAPLPIVTHSVPVTAPMDVQKAQQQNMQLMQQRYDPNRLSYVPLGFQQSCRSDQAVDGYALKVSYPQNFQQTSIFNQPERIDWDS